MKKEGMLAAALGLALGLAPHAWSGGLEAEAANAGKRFDLTGEINSAAPALQILEETGGAKDDSRAFLRESTLGKQTLAGVKPVALPEPEPSPDMNGDMALLAYIQNLTPQQFAELDPATKANLKSALQRAANGVEEMEALDSLGRFLKVPSYPLSERAKWEGSQAQQSHRSWVNTQKRVAWGAMVAAAALIVATGGVATPIIGTVVVALVGVAMIQVLRLILGIPTYG